MNLRQRERGILSSSKLFHPSLELIQHGMKDTEMQLLLCREIAITDMICVFKNVSVRG